MLVIELANQLESRDRISLVGISAKFGSGLTPSARARARAASYPFSRSLHELFLSGAIRDSVPETRVRYYRVGVQFCPVVTARYEKGLRAIDDRETDEVSTHDRAGMLIG